MGSEMCIRDSFGIAWELGYLRGLEEGGLPIREADIFVGTSAGSQASVIVTSDKDWVDAAPLEKEAFDYFLHNAGSPNDVIDGGIIVFAAGNEYAAMAGYPGAYPDYISVAALAADGTPSCYSNYAMGVSIAAPGGDSDYHQSSKGKIYSTLPPSANEDGGENSHYGYMEGTSQACPHISGVAALGLSYAAELHRHFRADEFLSLIHISEPTRP